MRNPQTLHPKRWAEGVPSPPPFIERCRRRLVHCDAHSPLRTSPSSSTGYADYVYLSLDESFDQFASVTSRQTWESACFRCGSDRQRLLAQIGVKEQMDGHFRAVHDGSYHRYILIYPLSLSLKPQQFLTVFFSGFWSSITGTRSKRQEFAFLGRSIST